VEDISPGHGTFEVQQLLVLCHRTIDKGLQLFIRQVLIQRSPELEHQFAVFIDPSPVLHVKDHSC
jgi:hypothetical protein